MRTLLLVFVVLLTIATPVNAQEKLDFTTFETLPVLHEGRLKPMSSFAQIHLKQLSGETKFGDLSASHWLAITLFDPQNAVTLPVFKISDPYLVTKFNLDKDKKLYEFSDLKPGLEKTRPDILKLLEKPSENLNAQEQALLQLHENAATLTNLMRSFSALLPLDIQLPKTYSDLMQDQTNFMELSKFEKDLELNVREIVAAKGQNPNTYTQEELAIAKAAFNIQALRAAGQNNNLLRVIPSNWEQSKGEWFSPWAVLLQGQGSPETAFLLSQWSDLANAYRAQNAELWDAVSNDIFKETKLQSEDLDINRFKAEQTYSDTKPYFWIMTLYALAFLIGLVVFTKSRKSRAS